MATIATSAFTNQVQLTQISIPASITSIRQNAFVNCPNLTTINIPDGRLIIVTDNGEGYTMAGNAPIHVTSWDNVGGETGRMAVSRDSFNLLRQYPMDGTFVKDHLGDTYIFAGGTPLYLTSWDNVGGERRHPLVDGMALRTYADTGKFSHVREKPLDGTFVSTIHGNNYRYIGGVAYLYSYWSVYPPYTLVDAASL